MARLEGKVAIVTGGGRGIGREVALQLAADGADVMTVVGKNLDQAQEVSKQITKRGRKSSPYQVDVANVSAVDEAFSQIIGEYGKVDILVNNAGITRDGLLIRMKDQDWDDVLGVNLKGAFNCARAAAKSMIKNRYGRMINMTSVVGLIGNPGQVNYSASKAGLIGLTKSLAKELASRNITVNAVAPGFIETAMSAEILEKNSEAALAQIPAGRFGSSEEVASLVSFLVGEEASYITGQVIAIDGGLAM